MRTWVGLVAAAVLLVVAPPARADRAFGVRYQLNANGSIAMTGNTLLSCSSSVSTCAKSRAGTGDPLNNNDIDMRYVDIDPSAATFMASSATLSLPAGSTVDFAGLYWSAV